MALDNFIIFFSTLSGAQDRNMQLGFGGKGSHVIVQGHEHIWNGREWAEEGKQKEAGLMVGHLHIAEWNGISSPSLIYLLIIGKSLTHIPQFQGFWLDTMILTTCTGSCSLIMEWWATRGLKTGNLSSRCHNLGHQNQSQTVINFLCYSLLPVKWGCYTCLRLFWNKNDNPRTNMQESLWRN